MILDDIEILKKISGFGGDPTNNIAFSSIDLYMTSENKSIDLMKYFERFSIKESIYSGLLEARLIISNPGYGFSTYNISKDDRIKIVIKSKLSKETYKLNLLPVHCENTSEHDTYQGDFVITCTNDYYEGYYKQVSFGWDRKEGAFSEKLKSVYSKNRYLSFYDITSFNIKNNFTENKKFYDYMSIPYMSLPKIVDYITDYCVTSSNDTNLLLFSNLKGLVISSFNDLNKYETAMIFNHGTHTTSSTNCNVFSKYNFRVRNYNQSNNKKALGSLDMIYDFSEKTSTVYDIKPSKVLENFKTKGNTFFTRTKDDNSTFNNVPIFIQTNDSYNRVIKDSMYNSLLVKIYLRGVIERSVGMKVAVTFIDPVKKDKNFKYLTGEYMIEEIVHDFDAKEYNQTITLVSNVSKAEFSDGVKIK